MINKKITMLLIIMATLILPFTLSAVSEAGTIFLLIQPGSKPGAMGDAFVAQADDGFAGYWNTGAEAFNRKTQLGWMHSNWFGDVKEINDIYLEYVGFNKYYEGIGNLGFNIDYLTYGSQDRTDENGDVIDSFSSYEMAIAANYAFQTSPKTGVGVAFKYIISDLSPEGTGATEQTSKGKGMSFAFDFGVKHKGVNFGQILVSPYNGVISLYNLVAGTPAEYSNFSIPVENLDFGLNIQNIGPDITYINDDQKDPLPMNMVLGFSYRALESKMSLFTINADINKLLANNDPVYKRIITAWTDDNTQYEIDSTIFNVGAEYTYLHLLSLRTGYVYDKAGSIEGASFGAGIQYKITNYMLKIDFAMQPAGDLTDYNKTFSLALEF